MGTPALAVGGLTNIPSPQISAEEIDVTTLDSDGGFREFIAGFKDAGEISLEGNTRITTAGDFDAGQKRMYDLMDSGAVTNFVIEFPPEFQAVWTFEGIVTGFAVDAALEDAISFSATVRVTGKPELLTGAGAVAIIPMLPPRPVSTTLSVSAKLKAANAKGDS